MDVELLRKRMVEEQLAGRGIRDQRVLDAFRKVPRHRFVPQVAGASAYGDYPLPIGAGQTISQPYMVALMTEWLEPRKSDRVLEVGAGSGYQAAILAELVQEVYSVERVPDLAESASRIIKELGYHNITITVGDGTLGWPAHAPYDGIIVTAGAPAIPQSLVSQLAEGGRLVIPVGGSWSQVLTRVIKKGDKTTEEQICGCVFVPLVGKEGWKP